MAILDWALVEDLLFTVERGRPAPVPEGLSFDHLGPCLGLLRGSPVYAREVLARHRLTGRIARAVSELAQHGATETLDRDDECKGLEVVKVPLIKSGQSRPLPFEALLKRMEFGAREVGIDASRAKSIVAALEELISNIYDHSLAPETGLVAYHVGSGFIEFVIGDAGVGVLNSLTSNEANRSIRTEMEALQACIVDGRSRLGVGHGNGYRPLFRALQRVEGVVRMHSGNGLLEIIEMNKSVPRKGPRVSGLSIDLKFSP